MFKKIFSIILISLISLNTYAGSERGTQFPNGIAAVVDNHIITMDEVHRKLGMFIPQIQREARTQEDFMAKIDETGHKILDQMINEKLLVLDFEKKGGKIPDAYLNNHLAGIIRDRFNNDRKRYKEFLTIQGLSERDFKDQQRNEIIVGFLRGQIVKSQSEISPKKIEDYYNNNIQEFTQDEAVELYQISVIKGSTEMQAVFEERSSAVATKLAAGEDFEKVAEAHSQDNMAKFGGKWGWTNRSDMRKELSDAAFSLQKGQHNLKPVVLGNTHFYMMVKDRRPKGVIPINEVRKGIEAKIVEDLAESAQLAHIEQLRKRYFIKKYL